MVESQRIKTGRKLVDLTGHRFGSLVVVDRAPNTSTTRWNCLCDCGNLITLYANGLKKRKTIDCVCMDRVTRKANVGHERHGMSSTAEYRIWRCMIERCENPKRERFASHGARGIKVCDEWRNSFPAFFAYVGPRPSPKHSIDRFPDNDGNYEPGNVRWATQKEQCNNRRGNVMLTLNGKTATLPQWAESTGINYGTLRNRISKGWSDLLVLTTPVGPQRNKRSKHGIR